MRILPDYLEEGLGVVFCGTAVATASAKERHYYSGPGNQFWSLLHQSKLTPVPLTPADDHRVLEYGLGLTDLAKHVAASEDRGLGVHYDVAGFLQRIERYAPRWVAFNGKMAAQQVAKHLKEPRRLSLGRQAWTVGPASVFVVPSTSAAHCDPAFLEGADSKLQWFERLGQQVRRAGRG
jgi:TDG/mug DNA glycosylase family protein